MVECCFLCSNFVLMVDGLCAAVLFNRFLILGQVYRRSILRSHDIVGDDLIEMASSLMFVC